MTAFVGPAIRSLRERVGLTQDEVAARAELDRTYFNGIERGHRNPTVRALQRISDALDVTLDALFIHVRELADLGQPGAKREPMTEKKHA